MAKDRKSIKALGKRIDALRKERGLSMRAFANLCDIDKDQVNSLSGEGVDFRYSTLLKIAKGLEISVSELLEG